MEYLYRVSPGRRTLFLWVGLQLLLWSVFLISFWTHRGAWQNVPSVPSGFGAEGGFVATLLFILSRNLLICLLIVAGNIFLRFGWFTPGLAILILQGLGIGWLAGSNGFEVPFASVAAANMQYLRIGLWETTAYAIACGATLTKSLLIAKTFPAKTWDEQRALRDIRFEKAEKALLLAGGLALLVAGSIEAWFLVG
ncbi:MAG: hypothetical protein GX979_11265 [Firmicutes bacterium]|nr:hypothetical protein [Bacillota bacterium]